MGTQKGKEANEIDLVGIYAEGKNALVAEVKRQQRNYEHKAFMQKVESIKNAILSNYDITPRLLTMDEM